MIGNAHIDPVWLWQWPEGYQEVRATFRSAIERLDEHAELVFTSDSIVFFAWVEEHDPTLFERIRERIAEGRWQVIGGWWLEPDCNIPGGEALVRHALYGQRYLHDRFGITATTGANLDSFGHNATIPQLLAKSGMDSYVFMRPSRRELALPGPLFWWQSPDGSRVLAYRIPHEYGSADGELDGHVERALAELPPDELELMVFYGVGNHGGGPTRANLDSIARLDATEGLPRMAPSSARAYFDSVSGRDDIPVHAGDLQHFGVGCYTSHSGIKRWNRRAENVLQRAEKWCIVADVLGGAAYPREQLTEAWKLLLLNQFHDTLAGTSIQPAYDDARDQLGHACSLAGIAFNRAVQSLARRIDIPFEEGTTPVVVFNAHPWRVRADVELEFRGYAREDPRLVDDEGQPVPIQRTRGFTTLSGPRGRLAFAADLPPLGWRTYRVMPGGSPDGDVTARGATLENAHLRLRLDPVSGRIASLVIKETGIDLAAPDRGHAVVVDDRSDTWGHDVEAYADAIGEFECVSVRMLEHGPVRGRVRVESRFGASRLVEEYMLGARAAHVDARVMLDWREQLKLLKLRYPTTIEGGRATFETPYGHVERSAEGLEEPAQAWVDVSGDGAGLSVLCDAKYGYDVRGGDIGITAVRSPVWAWHDPRQLEPEGLFEHMDQGRQEFTVRLVPHAGDWRAAGTVRLAAELNQPPFVLLESFHRGDLPRRTSFATDGDGAIVLSVMKAAEDGDGALIVRAYESSGHAAHATIALGLVDRTIEAEFGPWEIRTFRVPRAPTEPVVETNLLEYALAIGP